jgi:hypothetical protein
MPALYHRRSAPLLWFCLLTCLSACGSMGGDALHAESSGTSGTVNAATPTPVIVDPLAQLPAQVQSSRLTTTIQFEKFVTFSPPPASSMPLVSATLAFVDWQKGAQDTSLPLADARIFLALLTNTGAGTINPDGSVTPADDHRLVWVIAFHDESVRGGRSGSGVQSGVGNGAVAPAAPSQNPVSVATNVVGFVDANTGAYLYTSEDTLEQGSAHH